MNNISEDRKILSSSLTDNQKEAFKIHNRIMRSLEECGFKPNPEQKVFPHDSQENWKNLLSTKKIYTNLLA